MQYTGYFRYLIICRMVNRVDLFYSVLGALIYVFPVFLPGTFLRVYDRRGGGGVCGDGNDHDSVRAF